MTARRSLTAAILAASAWSLAAAAQDAPGVTLTALECGDIEAGDLNLFSDTDAYTGQSKHLVVSCFLIKHGDEYLLWDTGFPDAIAEDPFETGGMAISVPRTLMSQIEELGLTAADIDYVGISHAHIDHAGNIGLFPDSTLIVQAAEWAAAFDPGPAYDATILEEFADGDNVLEVSGDHDVFGDGSVVTIFTPGHTAGHQALLVRLANSGPVILSGDWAHFTENRETRGIPDFNLDRADTLASFDRLERLAANLGARIIIQHEVDDIASLPKAPDSLD